MVNEKRRKQGHGGKFGKRRREIEIDRGDELALYVGRIFILVAFLFLIYWHYYRVLSYGSHNMNTPGIIGSLTLERCKIDDTISLNSSITPFARSVLF